MAPTSSRSASLLDPNSSSGATAGPSQQQQQQQHQSSLRNPFRRSFRRPDAATTHASLSTAVPEYPSRSASPLSDVSQKSSKTSNFRIDRSFEAVLASDKTYVLHGGSSSPPREPDEGVVEPSSEVGLSVETSIPPKSAAAILEEDAEGVVDPVSDPRTSTTHSWSSVQQQKASEAPADTVLPGSDSPHAMPVRPAKAQDRYVGSWHGRAEEASLGPREPGLVRKKTSFRVDGSASPSALLLSNGTTDDRHKGPSASSSHLPIMAASHPTSGRRRASRDDTLESGAGDFPPLAGGSSASSPTKAASQGSARERSSPRARSRTYGSTERRRRPAESPLGTTAALPQVPTSQRGANNESFSLAEEVALSSPPKSDVAEPSGSGSGGGNFRERMKKTSGFLRRLRGDSSSSSSVSNSQNLKASHKADHENREKPRTARSGRGAPFTGDSAPPLPRPPPGMPALTRKESQTSFASEGASSMAHSSYSISSVPTLRPDSSFAHADEVPVPTIPSKYAKTPPPASTSTAEFKVPPPQPGLSPSPRARTSSRVPLTTSEQSLRDPNGFDIVLPQRSSSQTQTRMSRPSNASSGDVRLVIRDWEHAMDHALKDSACDLDKKTEFTPKAAWGPSPVLPALDLSRYRERSGSFMEEGNDDDSVRKLRGSINAEATSTSLPSTPKTKLTGLRPSLGRGSISGAAQRAATYGYTGDGSGRYAAAKPDAEASQMHEATGLGIASPPATGAPPLPLQQSSNAANWPQGSGKHTRESASPMAASIERWAHEADLQQQQQHHHPRSDSPAGSIQTPRSSTRTSQDSTRPSHYAKFTHPREANSGASLASARSFETAAESAGLPSADPAKRFSVDYPFDAVAHPHTNGLDRSAHLAGDSHVRPPNTQRTSLDDHFEEAVDPEQSIRLITTNGRGPGSRPDDEATTPIDATVISVSPESGDQNGRLTPSSTKEPVRSGLGSISEVSRSPYQLSAPSTSGLPLRDRKALRPSDQSLPLPQSQLASPSSVQASTPKGATSPASPVADAASLNDEDVASNNGDVKVSAEERGIELAARCWAEDTDFLRKEKIAEWLGGIGLVNKAARRAYFERFNFEGLRVDNAFRRLCEKLFLRAETQQIDRILRAFSERYFECNRDAVFGGADEVHSVVFSLLLLNTDLHVADIQDRMTRTQFIRNTMAAIAESREMEHSAAGLAHGNESHSSLNLPATERISYSADHSPLVGAASPSSAAGGIRGRVNRSASIRSRASSHQKHHEYAYAGSEPPSSPRMSMATLPPGIVVSGASRAGDSDLEALLKDIYAAVKSERILLPENGGLSTSASQMAGTTRRRGPAERVNALKRGSIRGIQGLLSGSMSVGSENSLGTSPSSMDPRSQADPWGRVPTTSSALGFATANQAHNSATIGFASTLTQTIIREAQEDDTQSLNSVVDEPDDDELALMGPPWAKEGVLTRKHYWDSPGKRAKDKNWNEVFVVVQKGVLSMFRFGDTSGRSKQSQAALAGSAGGAVGGGNWLSSATALGQVSLSHTLANVLPPPGYNRERPHVFALTLPGGAVYFFQAGHEELVLEWVQTCNYWAARQSKEPLPGGVSNMEYGWNKVIPSEDFEELDGDGNYDDSASLAMSTSNVTSNATSNATSVATGPDASIYSNSGYATGKGADSRSVRSARSGRSSRSRAGTGLYQNLRDAANLVSPNGSSMYSPSGGSLSSPAPSMLGTTLEGIHKNERVFINEWKAPAMPTMPSMLKEDDQLDRSLRHMAIIENELTLHNELRQPMLQLYSPRGQNYTKALGNWERKSNHLLQELVKYQCYVDCLKNSVKLRADRKGMKEVEGMMRRADEEMAKVKEAEEGGPLPLHG